MLSHSGKRSLQQPWDLWPSALLLRSSKRSSDLAKILCKDSLSLRHLLCSSGMKARHATPQSFAAAATSFVVCHHVRSGPPMTSECTVTVWTTSPAPFLVCTLALGVARLLVPADLHKGVPFSLQAKHSPEICGSWVLPRSPHRCPGVYGRGCGDGLQLVRWGDGHTPFWACSKPECAYREFPPPCKLAPELTILLERRCNTLAVGAAPGAEEAVAWCGGVAAVLQAAGVDLRRALSAPVQAPTQAAAAAPAPAPPKAASAPPDEPAAQPAGGRPSSAGCGTVGGVLMRPGSSHGMAAAAGDAPEAIFPGRAPTAGATATAVDAQEAAKQVTAAERLAATHTAAGAAPLTACEQAPHGPRVLPHSQAAAQHTSTTEMATAEHTVSAQPLAAAQRDAPEQQQHAAAQHEHSDSALSPPAAAAQADVQPAAGVVGPTKAPGLQQPPEAARPRPVIFPLHEYERLSAQLKQFERQFGVCLVGQQGLVPQATLKAAR